MSNARKIANLGGTGTIPTSQVSGLGALATKNTVATADIADTAVTSQKVDATVNVKLAGDVVKSVYAETFANTTISATIPNDGTVPLNNEGTEILTASITPAASSNILQVDVVVYGCETGNTGNAIAAALFRDSDASAVSVALIMSVYSSTNNTAGCATLRYRVAAGSTSATTFKVRVGNDVGSMLLNTQPALGSYGSKVASSITITELKA